MGKIINWTAADGSIWGVSFEVVAMHRARYYALDRNEFDGDVERSLIEDTLPLFEGGGDYEVIDWIENNMNWEDLRRHAFKVREPQPSDPWPGEDFKVVAR